MAPPEKLTEEEIGAIRNMLDRQAPKQPYDYSLPGDLNDHLCSLSSLCSLRSLRSRYSRDAG
jgi:hypothetical protein